MVGKIGSVGFLSATARALSVLAVAMAALFEGMLIYVVTNGALANFFTYGGAICNLYGGPVCEVLVSANVRLSAGYTNVSVRIEFVINSVIVTVSGDLNVGGVITSGAGIVCVAADLSTSGKLGAVMLDIVSECSNSARLGVGASACVAGSGFGAGNSTGRISNGCPIAKGVNVNVLVISALVVILIVLILVAIVILILVACRHSENKRAKHKCRNH